MRKFTVNKFQIKSLKLLFQEVAAKVPELRKLFKEKYSGTFG